MDRTSYTNLAKAWEFVEDHAFSRQSVELNAVRTRAEETGIAQGSAAQAELLRVLVHMIGASSVIAVGTGSVVETLQLVNGLENGGQLTAVDSSSQGIALIRTLFNHLSDEIQTTLRAVNAPAGVFLPRLNAETYDLIVVAGDPGNYDASFEQAPAQIPWCHRLHRHAGFRIGRIRGWRTESRQQGRQIRGHAYTAGNRGIRRTFRHHAHPYRHRSSCSRQTMTPCRRPATGAAYHFVSFRVPIIWLTAMVPSSSTVSTSSSVPSSAYRSSVSEDCRCAASKRLD